MNRCELDEVEKTLKYEGNEEKDISEVAADTKSRLTRSRNPWVRRCSAVTGLRKASQEEEGKKLGTNSTFNATMIDMQTLKTRSLKDALCWLLRETESDLFGLGKGGIRSLPGALR